MTPLVAFLVAVAPFVRVGQCESHMTNASNGVDYGYWQFTDETWRSVTGLPGHASDYSLLVQLEGAVRLQRERGWSPWPYCGRFA